MTRKLSLITAVGIAALSVGAPAAFGKVHANAEVAHRHETKRVAQLCHRGFKPRPGIPIIERPPSSDPP